MVFKEYSVPLLLFIAMHPAFKSVKDPSLTSMQYELDGSSTPLSRRETIWISFKFAFTLNFAGRFLVIFGQILHLVTRKQTGSILLEELNINWE